MIILNNDSNISLYQQIYEQLKEQIIAGQLAKDSKLPSTRTLATALQVSRNTVENAYLQLCSEGYVGSRPGSGFIVEVLDMDIITLLQHKKTPDIAQPTAEAAQPEHTEVPSYRFQYGNLSATDFPLRLWKRISNTILSTLNAEHMTSYSSPKGEPDLQNEIMKYINRTRGVSCNPEQIIISAGMEHSLSLLCQLFRKDYAQLALEDPGYTGAKDIFLNNGYQVVSVGLDKDGINIEELEACSARIVYVTPSHQLPTGAVMPIQRRLKLLDWAFRHNAIILEDDYDGDLRYNSKPIPSIQSIDSKGTVIYIGTFSKALSPSLRINYMVLPQSWLARYEQLFSNYQTPVAFTQQKILYHFMHEGHWDRHLRRIVLANKKKHDLLIQTIEQIMGDHVIIHGDHAGLHILLETKNGLTENELIHRAREHSVDVMPVSTFWMRTEHYPNNMVMLGFGGMSEDDIVAGIHCLNQAWFIAPLT
ncbi:MAG: PLP-dependent aminotransferase family protein [Gorillibacterium sp.]|nr:PLP-dependent aminotransferase family protein [Gorillibacterium sp.]